MDHVNKQHESTPQSATTKLMTTWVTALADQVKNPVAGLSAAAGLIDKQMRAYRSNEKWDPSIVEEAVRLMQERLSRFDHYMNELAGLARSVELFPKWWDLKSEWREIQQFVVRRMPGELSLLLVDSDTSAHLWSDKDKFMWILSTLAINSLEAVGPNGNAEVRVRYASHNDEFISGMLIEVEDNGPGFSDDSLANALESFYTTKEAGTGLGLAMVEKYVRAHNGWVKIRNSIDSQTQSISGAVVSLFFPTILNSKERS